MSIEAHSFDNAKRKPSRFGSSPVKTNQHVEWCEGTFKRKGMEGFRRMHAAMIEAGHIPPDEPPPPTREEELEELLRLERERASTLEKQIAELLSPDSHLVVSHPRRIAAEVAKKHNLVFADLKGARRHKNFCIARQEAMWRIKQDCRDLSLAQIGRVFGNRDHTTVLHACRAHEKRMAAQ